MILVSLPPRNFPACHVKNPVVIKCDFYIDIVFVINVMDLVSYLKNWLWLYTDTYKQNGKVLGLFSFLKKEV